VQDYPDFPIARRQMVETQIAARGITDRQLLEVMASIPRHLFVDEALWPRAYDDNPLPIGEGQTISQPYMVAIMTQALGLTGKEKVLEIGTGSGYQTAILAKLAEWVYTIERIPSLMRRAQRVLEMLGIYNVSYRVGDGTKGWPEHAPYDGIIVTAGSPRVPQPLLEQLAEGGRLVIPVGDSHIQQLKRITRRGDEFITEDLGGCRFVKLVGEHGW